MRFHEKRQCFDYVRNKELAGLFNDLVMHLLTEKPDHPISSLRVYCEDTLTKSSPSDSPDLKRLTTEPISGKSSQNVVGGPRTTSVLQNTGDRRGDAPADSPRVMSVRSDGTPSGFAPRHAGSCSLESPRHERVSMFGALNNGTDPIIPPLGIFGEAGSTQYRRSLMYISSPSVEVTAEMMQDGWGMLRQSRTLEGTETSTPDRERAFSWQRTATEIASECDTPTTAAPKGLALLKREQETGCVDEEIKRCEVEGGHELVIDSFGLTDFPQCILSMTNIVALNISYNNLTSLPDDLGCLVNLTSLSAQSNELKALPNSITQLVNLKVLQVHQNQLQRLPDDFRRLQKLETLNLDWNELSGFPSELCDITTLETLYMIENPAVDSLPLAEMGRFESLSLHIDNLPSIVKCVEAFHENGVKGVQVTYNAVFPHEIIPGLFLGSLRSAQYERVYVELGINYVATIGRELNAFITKGMEQLQLNVDDLSETDLSPMFDSVHNFIDKAMANNSACLVHCFKGQSRSATMVITYLMKKNRWTRDEAFEFVKSRRECINPNRGFWKLMAKYEETLGL